MKTYKNEAKHRLTSQVIVQTNHAKQNSALEKLRTNNGQLPSTVKIYVTLSRITFDQRPGGRCQC